MSFISFVGTPGHILIKWMIKGKNSFGSFFSSRAAMNNIRSEMTSYAGKAMYDSMNLTAHLKTYNHAMNKLKRYTPTFLEKITARYISNPTAYAQIRAIEVKELAKHLLELLEAIQLIENDEKIIEFDERAEIFQDAKKLRTTLNELRGNINEAIIKRDLSKLKKSTKKGEKRERRREKRALRQIYRVRMGKTPAHGFTSYFLGVGTLSHHLTKKLQWAWNWRKRKYEHEVLLLQKDIQDLNGEKAGSTNEALAHIVFTIDKFETLEDYYEKADYDRRYLMSKLFNGIKELINDQIIPFLSHVQQLPEARIVENYIQKINFAFGLFKDKLSADEESQFKADFSEVQNLLATCEEIYNEGQTKNAELTEALTKKYGIK